MITQSARLVELRAQRLDEGESAGNVVQYMSMFVRDLGRFIK